MKSEDWISVEDRLPEEDQNVFIITGVGHFGATYIDGIFYDEDGHFPDDPSEGYYPTHWMPIVPPTPKQK